MLFSFKPLRSISVVTQRTAHDQLKQRSRGCRSFVPQAWKEHGLTTSSTSLLCSTQRALPRLWFCACMDLSSCCKQYTAHHGTFPALAHVRHTRAQMSLLGARHKQGFSLRLKKVIRSHSDLHPSLALTHSCTTRTPLKTDNTLDIDDTQATVFG